MQKLFSSNKLQELIKREKISQKPYLTDYSLLIMQDLWQAHVKYKQDDKKYETFGIEYKDYQWFLNTKTLKVH